MRKLLCLTVSLWMLLQLCMLPLSAMAETVSASSADVVFTLSDADGYTGQTVSLELHIDASAAYDVFGVRFRETDSDIRYYPDILSELSFSDYESIAAVSDMCAFDCTPENDDISKQAISVSVKYPENGPYTGLVCRIQFRISKNAKPGAYTVGEGMFHNVRKGGQKLSSAVIPATLHVMHPTTYVPAKAPTCADAGNREYYKCNICRGYFADPFCQTPVTDEERFIAPDPGSHAGPTALRDTVAATCTNDGFSGDRYCIACGTVLRKGTTVAATGAHVDADGAWSVNESSHDLICGCGKTFLSLAHTFSPAHDDVCHWQECTVCGYQTEIAEHDYPEAPAYYYRDANGHSRVCVLCKSRDTAEAHVFDENGNVCLCGYQMLTPEELDRLAQELLAQYAAATYENPISDAEAVTAILELRQQAEQTGGIADTTADTIRELLGKLCVIRVNTETDNSAYFGAACPTVTPDTDSLKKLVPYISAEDAGMLSLAVREAGGNPDAMPTLYLSLCVQPIYGTEPEQALADEYIADHLSHTDEDTRLTVLSRFAVSVEKKFTIRDTVICTDTLPETNEAFTFTAALPYSAPGIEKTYFLLQTHANPDGAYTTNELQLPEASAGTVTVTTPKAAVYTLCVNEPIPPSLSATAVQTSDSQITVDITLNRAPAGKLITAFYGENGRLYRTILTPVTKQEAVSVIGSIGNASVKEVRVFLLTEQNLPVCPPAAADIQASEP